MSRTWTAWWAAGSSCSARPSWGGSSGAVTAAFLGYRDRIPDGSNCVLIYPDGGDRYLDTIYHDGWVLEKFGDISGLWQETAHQPAPVAG
ncbi:hypothetical protein ACFQ0T_22265 [Kitasatospora gansuensis]